MKEYRCKKENCNGTVRFPERNERSQPNKTSDRALVILEEPLAECDVCETAYFESELTK